MDIQEYIEILLNQKNRSGMLKIVSLNPKPFLSKNEKKRLLSELYESMKQNKRHVATSIALALTMADPDDTISRIRRAGYFRASRYNLKFGCVKEVVNTIYGAIETLNIKPSHIIYLESIIALHSLAVDAQRLQERIIKKLKSRKDTSLKTTLAFINQIFHHGWERIEAVGSNSIRYYSCEDIAEGYSTILSIYDKEFKLSSENWIFTDDLTNQAMKLHYEELVVNSCKINQFKIAETLIDGLPYKAIQKNQTIAISSIDPNIEKSVRLGYSQMEIQIALRLQHVRKMNFPSIENLVDSLFEAGLSESMIIMKSKPIKRLTLNLIDDQSIFSPFSNDSIFFEEVINLMTLDADSYSDDIFKVTKINKEVSNLDIFKIQRFFNFVSYAYNHKINDIAEKSEQQILATDSVIIHFTEEQLLLVLGRILPNGNPKELLKLMTMDEKSDYWDIQYNPFIKVGDNFVVSPAIIARSNLVRNIVCSKNLRPNTISTDDPMQKAVVNALMQVGFMVESGVTSKINGRKCETDIFAWRDNIFFIFECKNAYHPCTPHEMCNSFDHIKTAKEQLDIRMEWFNDPLNQSALFSQLDWKITATSSIYSCIITANRIFNGSTQGTHPVRQAHELINVILRGHLSVNDSARSFWKSTEFHADDLVNYIQGNSVILDQLNALEPINYHHHFPQKTLIFESYFLNLEQLKGIYDTKYLLMESEALIN